MNARRVFLICVLLFACATAQKNGDKKKKSKDSADGKIVGGKDMDISGAPFQVSIATSHGQHFCGGSIISARWILTAAHCFPSGTTARSIRVIAGTSTSGAGGAAYSVSHILLNPDYHTTTQNYDVALLLLRSSLPLNGKTIDKIRIARKEPQAGEMGQVTGWGVNHEDSETAMKKLQFASIPIVDKEECVKFFGSRLVNDKHICAGFLKGGIDACQGDSGGPFTVKGEQVGVVSWGVGCARAATPGVYTNLINPEIFSWISKYVKDL